MKTMYAYRLYDPKTRRTCVVRLDSEVEARAAVAAHDPAEPPYCRAFYIGKVKVTAAGDDPKKRPGRR